MRGGEVAIAGEATGGEWIAPRHWMVAALILAPQEREESESEGSRLRSRLSHRPPQALSAANKHPPRAAAPIVHMRN